jgi:hypothetical protein
MVLILGPCRLTLEPFLLTLGLWRLTLDPGPVARALDAHPGPVEVILRSWGSSWGRAGAP